MHNKVLRSFLLESYWNIYLSKSPAIYFVFIAESKSFIGLFSLGLTHKHKIKGKAIFNNALDTNHISYKIGKTCVLFIAESKNLMELFSLELTHRQKIES